MVPAIGDTMPRRASQTFIEVWEKNTLLISPTRNTYFEKEKKRYFEMYRRCINVFYLSQA